MVDYFKGDLTNKQHIQKIIKIIDKYDFYKEDIYYALTKQIHPLTKRKLSREILKYVEEHMADAHRGHQNNFIIVKPKDNPNRIIGFILWDYQIGNSSCCSLQYLFVEPQFRGKGIASTLIEKCLKLVDDAGYELIDVDFDKDNTSLITFYKKFGFEYIPLISETRMDRNLLRLMRNNPKIDLNEGNKLPYK